MNFSRFSEKLKLKLVLLDLKSILNIININNFDEFLNELSDDNVIESFYKLKKMDIINKKSLYNVLNDFNNSNDIGLFDLSDQVSLLMENYALEDMYFFNIISYLLIVEDYSINGNDLVLALDSFLDTDKTYTKEFNFNYKTLEKIREEK